MAWLHTWVGLLAGWLLFFVFATGTAGYFSHEIDRWMRPELPLATQQPPVPPTEGVALGLRHLRAHASGAQEWGIDLPDGRDRRLLTVWWREPASPGQRFGRIQRRALGADGSVAAEPKVRGTGGGAAFYRMHYALRYVPFFWASRMVGAAAMLMLLALVTGVIIHKKIFVDFFTFRPGKGARSWLDAHGVAAVLALPFFVMITYSGLLFFMYAYMPAGIVGAYGAGEQNRQRYFDELFAGPPQEAAGRPAALHALPPLLRRAEAQWGEGSVGSIVISHPRDSRAVISVAERYHGGASVSNGRSMRFAGVSGAPLDALPPPSPARRLHGAMLALHRGGFAGPWLRWLYFGSGLLGCAMIGTGLVLWTAKRKAKQEKRLKAGGSAAFGFQLVETLNIAAIAGLATAMAAYFWANRLLPVEMPKRADWEFHCMFIAWGLLALHAALRMRFTGPLRVWLGQCRLAALAFALLPALNWLTSDRHLGISLPAGDWALAGVDLTMLGIGGFFALAAARLRRKLQA